MASIGKSNIRGGSPIQISRKSIMASREFEQTFAIIIKLAPKGVQSLSRQVADPESLCLKIHGQMPSLL